MNLSGNPEHREAYVLSAEPAGPATGTVSPAGRAAGELEGEPLVGVLEIHVQQLGDAADPVGHGVAVQVEPLRGLDDGSLRVEVGRERPDRRVGPGLAELLQRRELITHRGPGDVGGVPLHQHPLHADHVVRGDPRRRLHDRGELAAAYGRPVPEPSSGGFLTAVRTDR
jgi:hypothetical protein